MYAQWPGRMLLCMPMAAASLIMTSLLFVGLKEAAQAAPMPAPDLTLCQVGYFYPTNITADCCPSPPTRPVKSFSLEEYEGKRKRVRVRRPVHRLDAGYWDKYNRAYQLLSELPDDDPRSHYQQQLLHCAYCDAALPMPWVSADGSTSFLNPGASYPNETLQIHYGWNLLPWHRWFLYFHERILGSLLGDEDFALPFWNWDNQLEEEGYRNLPNTIAYEFASSGAYPYLFNANRSRLHQPPVLVDLNFVPPAPSGSDGDVVSPAPVLSDADLRQNNLALMHQVIVSGAPTADTFFGRPVRAGDVTAHSLTQGGQGTIEAGPHDTVHVWTGNEETPDYSDMGTFYFATRDPMFFVHHANLDRLWTVWKQMGGRRQDLDDPDWLDTEFVFYDENRDLVKVRVGDGLDTVQQLGYTYEEVAEGDAQWISYNATPCSAFTSPSQMKAMVDNLPRLKEVKHLQASSASGEWPVASGEPVTVRVARPQSQTGPALEAGAGNSSGPGDDLEEVLILEGVQVNWTSGAHFEVFLMLANATADTPVTCAEFTGMFSAVPRLMNVNPDKHKRRKVTYKLGIGSKLRQLGATSLSHIAVTILPGRGHASAPSPLLISHIKIRLER